jgi:hypothetical protein
MSLLRFFSGAAVLRVWLSENDSCGATLRIRNSRAAFRYAGKLTQQVVQWAEVNLQVSAPSHNKA